MLTDFNTIKDIIKDDDFGFFLDAYKDVVENWYYKNNNANYNVDETFKNKINWQNGLTVI